MEKIKNLSVRKTLLLYLSVSLVCSFFLSAGIMGIASDTQEWVWRKYVDWDKYFEAMDEKLGWEDASSYYSMQIPRPLDFEMSRTDHFISECCDFLNTYTVLLLSIIASGASGFLFYKHKLKRPIEELNQASKKIAENELDFRIAYDTQDEMGQLCREFERMREQLERNNRKLWRTVEEERALRAAISHDIRSPLSVLKGYQEMLIDYLSDRTISVEKAIEMLKESGKQIDRMDVFVETMRKMSSLEQRVLTSGQITAKQLEEDIQAELIILQEKEGKQIRLDVEETSEVFGGDKEIIMEVAENLLSNALRYAKKLVEVRIRVTCQELRVSVKDDGVGFFEDAETVTKAFHQQNVKDSLKHAGMGMYISRLYCEKHGGCLVIENKEGAGAVVTAVFRRIA